MIGPNPNTLGTVGGDFFQHGLVSFAGALYIIFAVTEICVAAGFKTELELTADWNREVLTVAGFQEQTDVAGGWPTCND